MFFILIILIIGSITLLVKKIIGEKQEPKSPPIIELAPPKTREVSLLMVGDALVHTGIFKDANTGGENYDFSSIYTNVKDKIKEYDLAFYNQESIIGGKNLGISSYPRFNTPDEFADEMVKMGFNIVSLANNHSMDKNEKGIRYSNAYWSKKEEVYKSGTSESEEERNHITIASKNGITYAMIAYTTLNNGLPTPTGKEYLVNYYSESQAKKDIEQVRDQVDVVMVSIHWGIEYTNKPSADQKKIAKYLSSLGVDVIIGHHPHVIQPIEIIDSTLVIYSLGNFISAQIGEDRLTGLMLSLQMEKTENQGKKTMQYKEITAELIYTHYVGFKDFKIIPFAQMNTGYLSDYSSLYGKYKNILTSMSDQVKVVEI